MTQQFVFTKEIKTERFHALAGMPVPSRFNKTHITWLKNNFGADCVKPLFYSKPEEFTAIISDNPKRIAALTAKCEEQDKQIKELQAEIRRLQKSR